MISNLIHGSHTASVNTLQTQRESHGRIWDNWSANTSITSVFTGLWAPCSLGQSQWWLGRCTNRHGVEYLWRQFNGTSMTSSMSNQVLTRKSYSDATPSCQVLWWDSFLHITLWRILDSDLISGRIDQIWSLTLRWSSKIRTMSPIRLPCLISTRSIETVTGRRRLGIDFCSPRMPTSRSKRTHTERMFLAKYSTQKTPPTQPGQTTSKTI